MTDFQRQAAQAEAADRQYQAWQAAQQRGNVSGRLPDMDNAAGQKETDVSLLMARLISVIDPSERLLSAMTIVDSYDVPSTGGIMTSGLIGRWEAQVSRVCPSEVTPEGHVEYDSEAVCKWFVARARSTKLPSTMFTEITEKKRLLGGYSIVHADPVRAWAFPGAIAQSVRGEAAPASTLFILEDGRAMTPRPTTVMGKEAPSMTVRTLPPLILKVMGHSLGLGVR
jgi:hypothetical protein